MISRIPKFLRLIAGKECEFHIPTKEKIIYLTFDDGPVPEVTPKVLDILKRHNAKATFFCVGDNIRKYPELYKRLLDEGHNVGNHTMHHSKGFYTNTNDYLNEIDECAALVGNNLFRPPHGLITPRQNAMLKNKGYKIIQWDVITYDWDNNHTTKDILNIIKRYTRNGSIIVMHDSEKAAPRVLEVLEDIIIELKQEGYKLATLA
jgi:peptidoglycan/xylan/chitin deacetylase (PgdA/CDA1 family)